MLLNLLLRNYLHYNLYDQADKLVSKTTFPQAASNNQTARYMYYLGVYSVVLWEYWAHESRTHQGCAARVHRCILELAASSAQVTATYSSRVPSGGMLTQ